MTDQVLSPERRSELAALLNDDQRLNKEYPKVAEYLDTALQLPGTGNDQMDSKFDLRLVHYAIDGSVDTTNPYWDVVSPAVFEQHGRRVVNGGSADGSARLAYAAMFLQSLYAYAIPSPQTIEWIVEFCSGRAMVEVGSGRGYWAGQLARVGIEIDAFDVEPPHNVDNVSFPRASGQRDVWHDVQGIDDLSECLKARADRVLFLCWPPGWGSTMASEALTTFQEAGGDRLIFIGEPRGGKTGDQAFFDLLASTWRMESRDDQFVSWWNLSDVAQGWVRN